MSYKTVLYNPLSGNMGEKKIKKILSSYLVFENVCFYDITKIPDINDFLSELDENTDIIIAGGDGTLNRFLNSYKSINNKVYYIPSGNGNDFARDILNENKREMLDVTEYIKSLPTAFVNGEEYKFLNNVGFGLDGYCCAEAERQRMLGKKPKYSLIALKGLLFKFKPIEAKVTVDGTTSTFKSVYLAPSMYGKFYGGGMKMAPDQNRFNSDGKVSLVILHNIDKITVLRYFHTIFKGTHIKIKKAVKVLTGNEIEVEFKSPAPIQIDGEVIENSLKYKVVSKVNVKV